MASGFADLQKTLSNLGDELDDEVNEAAAKGVNDLKREARRELLAGGHVWTGALSQSLVTNTQVDGSITSHEVVATMPYAKYVEYGTGIYYKPTYPNTEKRTGSRFDAPNGAPVEEIHRWVVTNGITPRDPDDTTHDVAFAIATHIRRYGTRSHPFMRPAYAKLEQPIIERARLAAQIAVRKA